MSRKQESGQVFVLAALSMMVLIGIAAFCVNASYMFYQHMRMQAQVDEQTRLAAGSGCSVSTSTLDGGTLVIASTTFFGQAGNYCDGVLTKSPGGLFGSILRFPNKISVHAVAAHGGSTEPHFSMLGLKGGTGCSVDFSGSESITVTGNIYSDSSSSGTTCTSNNTRVFYQDGSQYYAPSSYSDPYKVTVPTTGPNAQVHTGGTTYCGYSVPSTANYYTPTDKTGIALLPKIDFNSGVTTTVLLPYCNAGIEYPGIYIVNNNQFKTNNGEVDVVRSTVVVANIDNFSLDGGVFITSSPSIEGYYLKGYGVYEATPCTPSKTWGPSGSGTKVSVDGLFDLSCEDLKFTGNADEGFSGSVVGYTLTFGGNSGSVTFNPPTVDPPRGAFLVQ